MPHDHNATGRISFLGLLAILFIGLKLTGYITLIELVARRR